MTTDEITERQQATQQYCDRITRVCAEIDHSEEERPSGFIHEPDCAWKMSREAKEQV